jgi:hypothetical protein
MRERAGILHRRSVARIAGAAVAAAGLAFIGLGTAGVGTITSVVGHATATSTETIVSITESCSGGVTTGVLTVDNAVAGDTVTLEVYAHSPGSGLWVPTGSTETITMVADQSTYDFSLTVGTPYVPNSGTDLYNALRVQVLSTTGTFDGTTTKSDSYECSGPTTSSSSTTSSTTSSSSSPTTTTTSLTTSSSPTTTSSSPTTTSSSPTTTTTTGAGGGLGVSTTTTTSPSVGVSSSASTEASGVLGISTTTPGTGADTEFGAGLAMLMLGGGLLVGSTRLGRRKRP